MSLTGLTFVFICFANRAIPSFPAVAENNAYHIEIVIKGAKNRDIQLCKYFGADMYPVDATAIDRNGKAVFSGPKPLAVGMYTVVTGQKPMFDFLISDTVNQVFGISTTKKKQLETLSFNGSPENEIFVAFARYISDRHTKEKKSSSTVAEIESLTKQIDAKEAEIRTKFPGSLLESVATAMNPARPANAEIPETSDAAKRNYLYEFRRKHYWDKLTLTDARLQNTPILVSAIDGYFDGMVVPNHDSIISAIDFVLSKSESDTAMMNFLAKYLFDKYYSRIDDDKSQMTGIENIAVHIIDRYYLTGKANAGDMAFIKDITGYADRNRATLTGQQAKELRMETVSGNAESLYDIDSPYTLVCFFDASCSHCKHEIPEVYKVFRKFGNRGLAGFCVYVGDDRNDWLQFVSKYNLTDWINVWDPKNENDFRIAYSLYSVPQVYLLDGNKRIAGRGLNSASLARLLKSLIKE
jgi:peroxiredoxin